jgi:LuxR family transcriptional regulator, maltose regulon positive regulatory protein
MEKLNASSANLLTLVSAPAGFGKTTLVSDWMRDAKQGAAWLALEEDDNDVIRFLTYVVAALRNAGDVDLGESVLALLQSPQPAPLPLLLSALAQEFSSPVSGRVIVLDDYHVISAKAVHEAVIFLLEHVPGLRWVIITRADPPLPLARLRARRQLLEVRAVDLRFSLQESTLLLNSVMQLALSAESVQELDNRTEGWVTGLHLAGLALQNAADHAAFVHEFSGSHRYVVDYLVDEVLDRLAPQTQGFLLQTSILDRFCAGLCDSIVEGGIPGTGGGGDNKTETPHVAAQEMLEAIENANLFLMALDDERCWYRYHHLFGDLLRQRLRRQRRWDEAVLHRRAAYWFAEKGLVEEAVRHAMAAADFGYAADLLEQRNEVLWTQGGFAVLQHWLSMLPEDVTRQRPRLLLAHAWADFLTDSSLTLVDARLRAAELAIQQMEAAGNGAGQAKTVALTIEDARELQGIVAAVRAAQYSKEEAIAETIAYAQQALACLPAQNERWRSVALLCLGFAYEMDGAVRSAVQTLEEAIHLCYRVGNDYAATVGSMALARTHLVHGRLQAAAAIYRDTLARAQRQGMGQLPITAQAHVNLGRIYYEWNELDIAAQQLWQGVERMQGQGGSWLQFEVFVLLARLEQARGGRSEALAMLQRAEEAARAIPFGWTPAATTAAMVRARLALGVIEGASAWLAQVQPAVGDSMNRVREAEHLIAARVFLALNRADEALTLLDHVAEAAEGGERWKIVVEARILAAQALHTLGQEAAAYGRLQSALALAEAEGYVRSFLDEGDAVHGMLTHFLSSEMSMRFSQYAERLTAAFDGHQPGTAATAVQQTTVKAPIEQRQPQQATFIEPLSARELELLRLVGAGYSNQEIADKLVITLGTVKSHLNHIFDKLGVQGRVRAINLARELALIE